MLYLNNEKTTIEQLNVTALFKSVKTTDNNNLIITISKDKGLWGFGERFDYLNQKGLQRDNEVYEKFTNQGNQTYLPIPFFLSNDFGVFIDTPLVFSITSTLCENENTIEINADFKEVDIHIFKGTPKEQIRDFLKLNASPVLPPKWCFGPWMSANRWNSQEVVLEMAKINKELGFYHTAIVIEAWSDEATFYTFNNKELWPNPKKMVKTLNDHDLKVILWQIPVFKKLDEGQVSPLHDEDCKYAVENNLVVTKKDGSPYTIPMGRWFEGSMIPDFTNPDTNKWWFEKRQYLLDMGVSGFKTDGGEFIYSDDTHFFDGSTGKEMKNKYALSYTKAYYEAMGEDKVLFSRAGYLNSWQTPVHWAGDQLSIWSELKQQLIAGLNASVSGIFYWGFDIAGFAGAMPSKELYLRSFLLGTFSPIMQWHSEPIGGQFSEIVKSKDAINDRSPWNMASLYQDNTILEITRNCCNLRKKLLPYIYSEAEFSKNNLQPLMRPLFFEHPDDSKAAEIDDQYYLGRSLLVAPILEQNKEEREIYLPKGNWYDCQLKKKVDGNTYIKRKFTLSEIGLFINLHTDYTLLKDILV